MVEAPLGVVGEQRQLGDAPERHREASSAGLQKLPLAERRGEPSAGMSGGDATAIDSDFQAPVACGVEPRVRLCDESFPNAFLFEGAKRIE